MSSKKPGDGVLNGFLDQGSHFKGELTFDDTLRIDGKFEGTIRSANQLIIGETAEVDADIQVGSVSIDGTVRGTIVAKSKIEIHPHGKVFAQLTAPTLKIEEGALFQGACTMEARAAK
ncbi:MAG: bactofilin family protein [Thermoanaerobaculia bacterium]